MMNPAEVESDQNLPSRPRVRRRAAPQQEHLLRTCVSVPVCLARPQQDQRRQLGGQARRAKKRADGGRLFLRSEFLVPAVLPGEFDIERDGAGVAVLGHSDRNTVLTAVDRIEKKLEER